MKVGDKFYSKEFVAEVTETTDYNMFGVVFKNRNNSETNYNHVSLSVLESMIDHKEWFSEDVFNED